MVQPLLNVFKLYLLHKRPVDKIPLVALDVGNLYRLYLSTVRTVLKSVTATSLLSLLSE